MKDTTAHDNKGRSGGDEVRMMWRGLVWFVVRDGKGVSEAHSTLRASTACTAANILKQRKTHHGEKPHETL